MNFEQQGLVSQIKYKNTSQTWKILKLHYSKTLIFPKEKLFLKTFLDMTQVGI